MDFSAYTPWYSGGNKAAIFCMIRSAFLWRAQRRSSPLPVIGGNMKRRTDAHFDLRSVPMQCAIQEIVARPDHTHRHNRNAGQVCQIGSAGQGAAHRQGVCSSAFGSDQQRAARFQHAQQAYRSACGRIRRDGPGCPHTGGPIEIARSGPRYRPRQRLRLPPARKPAQRAARTVRRG